MKLKILRWFERLFYGLGDYFEDWADSSDPGLMAIIRNGMAEVDQMEAEGDANWEAVAVSGDGRKTWREILRDL